METIITFSLIGILTLLSGFFSGSEIALFSLSSTKVRSYKNDKNSRKQAIFKLLKNPRDLLVVIFIFNTLVNILLQNVLSNYFGALSSWWFKIGVPLALTFIFGEIIPKYFSLQNSTTISMIVSPYLSFLSPIAAPMSRGFTKITDIISRVMFFFLRKNKIISREEIHHVLATSKEQGVLTSEEAKLIHGYLDLRESTVKEIMRPREDIITYDISTPLSNLIHVFVDEECSRIPIINGEIDSIIGILSAPVFFAEADKIKDAQDLSKLVEKPLYIPESAPALHAFRQLNQNNQSLALIVDEYGSISGLLATEDLVEEVVGEISDRRDSAKRYTPSGKNVIIASGKIELSELEEIFGIEFHTENNVITLGGWLTEMLGDIPKTGTHYENENFFFHVLASEANRVRRVYIRKLKERSE